MKILHLIQCTNLGGMERTTLERMCQLQNLGHECMVLSLNPLGALGPLLEQHAIPAEGLEYRGRGGWRSFPELRRKLNASSADALLMTGHNLLASLALGDLAIDRRVLSIHFHHEGVCPDWQWRLIYKTACTRFQTITFATDFIRKEAERIYPPVAKRAVTLPNPFAVPPAPSASDRALARTQLGIPDHAFVIGNAGWLIQRKRFDILLRVAAELLKHDQSALCVIAGDGPLRAELEALSQSLGIAGQVRWLGWQKDLRDFYLSLDVLVFNSDWDALGRTPVEALALGTPVVASVEKGGLVELICDDRFGFLTDRHDIPWMIAKLLELRNDAALKESIVSAARAHIAEKYSPVEDGKKLADLLGLDSPAANSMHRQVPAMSL
jgi:glycosyltransferase involved in cell wall biosynthesis